MTDAMKGAIKTVSLLAAGFVAGGLVCSNEEDTDEGGPDGLVIQESPDKGTVSEGPSADSCGGTPVPEAAGEGDHGPTEEGVGDEADRGGD